MNDSNHQPLVKILYIIPEGEEDAGLSESLWAYALGNNHYQLQNIPVFAEHLSIEDEVLCDELSDNLPVIRKIVRRSGNRTLRVLVRDETSEDMWQHILDEMHQRGIIWERATSKSYMFNVAPTDQYSSIRDLLKMQEDAGLIWLYEQLYDDD
jgi:hypothetical protein